MAFSPGADGKARSDTPLPSAPPTERLLSLDAFRGLTVLGMLLVNNAALDDATPTSLIHADGTGGVHFADLVFPWFLLLVGVALPFSFASHRRKAGKGWARKALARGIALFCVGCLVDSSIARTPYLGFGVLQLIGVASTLAALGCLTRPIVRALFAVVLLGGYGILLHAFPVPQFGAGNFATQNNAVAYLNDTYLTPLGLRGLLSVAPTSALALLGTLAGELLVSRRQGPAAKAFGLLVGGATGATLGLLWGQFLPLNKPLWTPPYILFAGGAGTAGLGVIFLCTDTALVRRIRFWATPLAIAGANPLIAYVAPILVKVNVLQAWHWPQATSAQTVEDALRSWCFAQAGRIGGGWLYTLVYIAFWWGVLAYLYRRRVFVRL